MLRQQVQPGDNVESVDMELSDDETEGKQKGRGVLVDVRSQDRDMRAPISMPPPSHHMDMDMRMIPLPAGCGPQDVQNIHQAPPPPPPPPQQFHHRPPDFNRAPPDFQQNNSMDFRPNQGNFRPNAPLTFNSNRQDFPPNQQDFPPNQEFPPDQEDFPTNQQSFVPNQQNFPPIHQDFNPDQQDFPPNQHNFHQRDFRPTQDFDYRENSMSRGRFPQNEQLHRDNLHWNDRGGRGRGFRGSRRDRYSDENNKKNNRRQRSHDHAQRSPPDMLPNNRPLLIEPSDGGVPEPGRRESTSFQNNRLHDEAGQSDFSGNSSRVDKNRPTPTNNNNQNTEIVPVTETKV